MAAASGLAIACVGLYLFLSHWPFHRQAIIQALESGFATKVEALTFRETYLPHPGCVLEGVVIGSSIAKNTPPPVTIRQLVIESSYAAFLMPGKHISSIRAKGFRLFVPAYAHPSTASGFPHPTHSPGASQISVDQFLLNEATIEVDHQLDDKVPLRFDIDDLVLGPLATGRAARFRVKMRNPKPAGLVQCAGDIGPWNGQRVSDMPLSGRFSFQHADLSTFDGIAGILNASGDFGGRLGDFEVKGSSDVPDFQVAGTRHTTDMKTQFDVAVNGLTGDTILKSIITHFGNTTVVARGNVADGTSHTAKTASVSMAVNGGKVEDILRIFLKADRPPLKGPISLEAKAVLPPESRPFVQKIQLDGTFAIQNSRFMNPSTKENVDKLSERARGIKDDPPSESVKSNVAGTISMRDGLAHVLRLWFTVPGATANLAGTYSLLTEKVDLLGTLRMEAELSRGSKGVKSVLLKLVDPLFRRKSAGAVVPVKLGGTYSHPTFGLAITPKK